MGRMINEDLRGRIHTEKITNEPSDEIIGHSEFERKYFTIENNDIIYKRLKSEVSIKYLPYLGPCIDFGMGDICIEEAKDIFKFYIIDRASKFEYEEFDTVEGAIQKLISYYKEYEMVDSPEKMEEIFYQTLDLSKNESIVANKNYSKTLKPKK